MDARQRCARRERESGRYSRLPRYLGGGGWFGDKLAYPDQVDACDGNSHEFVSAVGSREVLLPGSPPAPPAH